MAWASFGLGVLLVVSAVVCFTVATASRFAALRGVPWTLSRWRRLMVPAKEDAIITRGNDLGYVLRVTHHTATFWENGRPHEWNMARVHVPLGSVAMLPYRDVLSEKRFFDASSFCASNETTGGQRDVAVLFRSLRWQILISGDDIRGPTSVIYRMYVAVHTWFDHDLPAAEQDPSVIELFNKIDQLSGVISGWVKGRLDQMLQQQDYAQVMRSLNEHAAALNKAWQDENAAQANDIGDSLLKIIARHLRVQFTGVVVKALFEKESDALQVPIPQITRIENTLSEVEGVIAVMSRKWQSDFNRGIENIRQVMRSIQGLNLEKIEKTEVDADGKQVQTERVMVAQEQVETYLSQVEHSARSAALNLKKPNQSGDTLTTTVERVYDEQIKRVEEYGQQFVSACGQIVTDLEKMPVELARSHARVEELLVPLRDIYG